MESLELVRDDVRASVVPARGAIVSALSVGGREILYMDGATLADPAKNVRGGIPILFPFAGRLADDRLVAAGTSMPQHGFARGRPWEVAAYTPSAVTLEVEDDAATRAVYPWSFRCAQTVSLVPRGLRVTLVIEHRADPAGRADPMPVAPGWHPYFVCATAAKMRVAANLPGLSAGVLDDQAEHDFGVPSPEAGRVTLSLPDLGNVALDVAVPLRHLQVWTLPGRPFVCVEPFLGPANTINTPAAILIAPGRSLTLWFQLALAA